MNNFDVNTFMSDMFNMPWHDVNRLSCPNEVLSYWSTMYRGILDKHMSIIEKKVRHLIQPHWINGEIKNAMYTRDYLKKINNHAEYKAGETG